MKFCRVFLKSESFLTPNEIMLLLYKPRQLNQKGETTVRKLSILSFANHDRHNDGTNEPNIQRK